MIDVLLFILAFIVFDLVALRFGATSRSTWHGQDERPDW